MNFNDIIFSNKVNGLKFRKDFDLLLIDDYLSKNIYEDLKNTFPKEGELEQINQNLNSLKFSSLEKNELAKVFLNKNKLWKTFVDHIDSFVFFKDLKNIYNLYNFYFCKEEASIKKKLKLSILKRKFNFFKETYFEFTFNELKFGEALPHTDVPRKILSIVFFFPSDNWNDDYGGDVKILKPLDKNLENNWLNKVYPFEQFKELLTINYKSNRLYCFKKSKNSYHGITKVTPSQGDCRKVFMINLCYKNPEDIPINSNRLKNKIVKKFFSL